MILWLDTETRGRLNLPSVGVYRYAEDVQIMLWSWAVDDGPITVEEKASPRFWDAFCEADRIIAHNAEFDRTVIEAKHPGIDIRADRWYCTMAQAHRHGLPGGLDALCDILKIPQDQAKMKDSRDLLFFFCKPDHNTGRFHEPAENPEKWARFKQYGGQDISAMRAVHAKLPTWNDDYELPIWRVDQKINSRGFQVDTTFVRAAMSLLKDTSAATDAEVVEATGGALASARQRDALLAHVLNAYGVDLPDLTAATLERRIKDDSLPDGVRELLALRQQSAKTSTSKYATVLRCANTDGRLRGSTTYAGAMRTLRWSGNRFQPHNQPRPHIGALRGKGLKDEVALSIEAVRNGVYDLVGRHPVPEVLASAVRGCMVAAPGKKLVVGDYANIEGRGLAWLAGEQWKLDAFQAYDDGDGPDLYKVAYSTSFGVPIEEVDDGDQRQIGKVQELFLGYGGGVGAFVTGAETYKIDLGVVETTAWPLLPEDVCAETMRMWEWACKQKRTLGLPERTFRTCDGIKRLWRRRHPKIVQFWANLEAHFHAAVAYSLVHTAGKVKTDKKGTWVRIKLPSGRYLSYPGAHVKNKADGSRELRYLGKSPYTRQWGPIATYGGKLAENVTQALCRDLLAEGLLNCEGVWGLPAVMHVHDEIVAEVEEGNNTAVDDLSDAMRAVPWAEGLPLAVAVHETNRYHKE